MILNKTRPKLNFFDWIFYQLEVTINKKHTFTSSVLYLLFYHFLL